MRYERSFRPTATLALRSVPDDLRPPDPVLIPQRREMLVFIRQYLDEEGVPPTFREIAEILGLHLSTAHHHAVKLEEAGYLEKRLVERVIQETRYFPTELAA